MRTLLQILKENWAWRTQVINLGLFDLRKQARGAVLGYFWFFAKPAVYILVFWFALEIGLKSGSSDPSAPPYILWLTAGLIPWFYIQAMLGAGVDVFHRYSYLVNKIKFPLSCIPTIYMISTLIIHLGLVVILFAIYFACGQGLDLYLLQIPVAMLAMIIFFELFSLLTSCLSALSKDFKNLMATLSTPFFWLSGIIFNVIELGYDWLSTILAFNPITVIAYTYRAALYDKYWIWERPEFIVGFAVAFFLTLVCAIVIFKRTREEVYDVL